MTHDMTDSTVEIEDSVVSLLSFEAVQTLRAMLHDSRANVSPGAWDIADVVPVVDRWVSSRVLRQVGWKTENGRLLTGMHWAEFAGPRGWKPVYEVVDPTG